MSVSHHQKMYADCEGNGACLTRNSSKCIRRFDQITCECFIDGREPCMNGYCKPVMCLYGCELLRCMTCAQVHPLRNMPGNFGRRCKRCVAIQQMAEDDATMKSPDQEIKEVSTAVVLARCRICNVESNAPEDCERRHLKELNKILPITTGQRGSRRINVHNQNFDRYTAYGKIIVIACYLESDLPAGATEYAAQVISDIRVRIADALRMPPEQCITLVSTDLTNSINTGVNTLFPDCQGIRTMCFRYMTDIITDGIANPMNSAMKSAMKS